MTTEQPPKKTTTWWLSISSSKTIVTQKSLFYPWFDCIPPSQMWSFSFQYKLNYRNSQLIIKTKWKLKHNLLLELHSLEALQPGSSMDMRWLWSYISVKVSVLAFKASKNLGQAFRRTDSSLMTFEASAISRIEEDRKGKGRRGRTGISGSFLKCDQQQTVPAGVTGGVIRICDTKWHWSGSCSLLGTTELLALL